LTVNRAICSSANSACSNIQACDEEKPRYERMPRYDRMPRYGGSFPAFRLCYCIATRPIGLNIVNASVILAARLIREHQCAMHDDGFADLTCRRDCVTGVHQQQQHSWSKAANAPRSGVDTSIALPCLGTKERKEELSSDADASSCTSGHVKFCGSGDLEFWGPLERVPRTMTAAPGALASLAHVPRRFVLSQSTGSCAYHRKQLKSDVVWKESSV
jgi:hypothetical protein